ncbi:hypothetical protein ABES02_16475 [Neobacillus pocheonensis]|uniref:hypothetical protein n=1 Tax=Neobacillus pocheonensis TaxID=363869 RepID=UPI003D27820E
MENKKRYVPSRFNAISNTDDNGVVLFNSYTGAITYFSDQEKLAVMTSLKRTGTDILGNEIQKDLYNNGFLVSSVLMKREGHNFFISRCTEQISCILC